MTARSPALAVVWALMLGCGRYADFTLPPPTGEPAPMALAWHVAPEPVLSRGSEGEWDSVDALNPSVVRYRDMYLNLYSGFDGKTWHTGLATSIDPDSWTKHGKVLSPSAGGWEGGYIAANGSALVQNTEIFYWYQAGDAPFPAGESGQPRIGLARSNDGRAWKKEPAPVLDTGPRGSWDERGVGDPYVIQAQGKLYMFYLGEDRARRQHLGVALSTDGVAWWKFRDNPVLELGQAGSFDEAGLGEPAVWASAGRYWMLYAGRDRQEYRRLGLAVSRDGVRWERFSEQPVLSGSQPWNAKVVCDPTVEVTGNGIRVWFGGGDVAHPAENIHGQIGFAVLRMDNANLTK